MSQHDFDIDNATAAAARVDINLALKALGSLSSGPSAPTTTYGNMFWYDTSTNWLYVRNEANSAWVRFAYLDQTANKIAIVDDTSIVNTSGTQVGLLGDQTTASWQSGTGTSPSLVSPANVKAAILALQTNYSYTQPTATGAVGTYAFLWQNANVARSAGEQVAGSTLRYSGVGTDAPNTTSGNASLWQSGTPAGSWRCMGAFGVNGNYEFSTLWLRYA